MRGGSSRSAPDSGPAARCLATGTVNANVVPRPGPALSARPCASTSLADHEPEAVARRGALAGAGVPAEEMRQPLRHHLPPLVRDRDGDVRALTTRTISALRDATYTRVAIRVATDRTTIRRWTRVPPLEPELHDATDVRQVLRHTGSRPYIANLGDVEEVNLVYMAGLMQGHGGEGVLYDTTDEDRV